MINDLTKTKQAAYRMHLAHTIISRAASDFGPCLEIESALREVSDAARTLAGMARRMEENDITPSDDPE